MKSARLTIRTGALALTMLAAGCGPAADDPAAGGVSTREAEAINDAAAMLDNTGLPASGDDAVIVTNADEGAGNVE